MASLADVDKHRVTAVLVSHNGAVWLPEVVAALTSQTRPIDLITAVDTGSEDASIKLLKSARIPFFLQTVKQVLDMLFRWRLINYQKQLRTNGFG